MADECDAAEAIEQLERDVMMSRASAAANAAIPLEFECRECGEATTGARWCSKDCCKLWQERKK